MFNSTKPLFMTYICQISSEFRNPQMGCLNHQYCQGACRMSGKSNISKYTSHRIQDFVRYDIFAVTEVAPNPSQTCDILVVTPKTLIYRRYIERSYQDIWYERLLLNRQCIIHIFNMDVGMDIFMAKRIQPNGQCISPLKSNLALYREILEIIHYAFLFILATR